MPKTMETVGIQAKGGKEHFEASFAHARMNTHDGPDLTKDGLRRSIREELRAVPYERRQEWSAEIQRWLRSDESWLPGRGGAVAMFGGIKTEPDVLPLLPWLAERGVRAAFFAIEGDTMAPRVVADEGGLRAGAMGVLEPDAVAGEPVDIERLDAVLLPGRAFNPANGARLGRGKGHYDRVLDRLRPSAPCVGVCFHLQLRDAVPLEAHDRHVQALVTERGWIRIPG